MCLKSLNFIFSTVKDQLRKYRTPEEIRLGSMHSTNRAFERYFQVEPDDLRAIYRDTEHGDQLKNAN
jgi:hypothetical protein